MVFYRLTNNFGIAIIAMTVLIRLGLSKMTKSATQTAQKMKEVQAEMDTLKEKYGDDKRKLQEEQLKLYRHRGINPAAGCLPQVVQLVVLIGLFQVFNAILRANGNPVELINRQVYFSFLRLPVDAVINTRFLYLNLSRPDIITLPRSLELGPVVISRLPGMFLVASAALQFLSSKMMMPVVKSESKIAKKTKEKTDDMATIMQEQMLYMFPLMTILIGFRFPSGLVLYWLTFSILLMIDQYLRSGWGGLADWVAKVKR